MPTNVEALTSDYGVTDPENPWSNNILARDTVTLPDGTFARRGAGATSARVSGAALAPLRALATEAEQGARGLSTGMGSEGSEGLEAFAFHLGRPLAAIDERAIRDVFGDALYPRATITLEPLAESSRWWQRVLADCGFDPEEDDAEGDEALVARWREILAWFSTPGRFVSTCFVAIDAAPPPNSFAAMSRAAVCSRAYCSAFTRAAASPVCSAWSFTPEASWIRSLESFGDMVALWLALCERSNRSRCILSREDRSRRDRACRSCSAQAWSGWRSRRAAAS